MRWAWLALLITAALSGCLNEFEDANHVRIHSVDVAAPEVRTGVLTLEVHTTLDNGGAQSGHLELELKVFSAASGLLLHEETQQVGRMDKDTSRDVVHRVELDRQASIRLQLSLLQDGQIETQSGAHLNRLDALTTTTHETHVEVGAIDFFVENSTADRAMITAKVYMSNGGGTPSDALRAQIKARDRGTSLMADEVWLDVPGIAVDATIAHEATLDVPRGYNYDVEVVLWDGDVIVGSKTGIVQLLPTIVIDEDEKTVSNEPDLGDFSRQYDRGASAGYAEEDAQAPGLGLIALLLGLAAVTIRRKA